MRLPLLDNVWVVLSLCPVVYVNVVLQNIESPSGIIISWMGLNVTWCPAIDRGVTGGCVPWTCDRLVWTSLAAVLQCEATAAGDIGGLRAEEREAAGRGEGADNVLCLHSFC